MDCSQCGHTCEEEAIFCSKCSLPLLDAEELETVSKGYASLNRKILEKVLPEHLRIVGHLGDGGMATVYEAYDTVLEKRVALKVLPLEKANKNENVQRFRREAKLVSSLQHPHIVPFYSLEIHGGFHFFSMALMEGGTLASRIGKGMPWLDAISITRKIALALDYAHERGIIHRDIKPDNVMFDAGGQAMLSDFGIAKGLTTTKITATQVLMGTPAYISPEQILGKPLGPEADLYALGAMLFHMMTGNPPYTGEDVLPVITKHLNQPPPKPSEQCNDCPDWLDAMILKLLEKDPANRYKTAAELVENIHKHIPVANMKRDHQSESGKIFNKTDPTLTLISHPTYEDDFKRNEPTVPIVRKPRRKLWLVFALAAAIIVIAGIGLTRRATQEVPPTERQPIVSDQPLAATDPEEEAETALERLKHIEEALSEYEMLKIPDGSFKMGSWIRMRKDEMPIHRVGLSGFRLGKTEVSQKLWNAVMLQNPACDANEALPMHNVSWNEVSRFIQELNQQTGRKFRLPTEAEWEYASRATESRIAGKFGSREDRAWFVDNASGLKASGLREPNEWGLHDMQGNLWEWCADYYDPEYYENSGEINPQGPEHGAHRVVRGGAWNTEADEVRHANRHSFAASERDCTIGFRLAESIEVSPPSTP